MITPTSIPRYPITNNSEMNKTVQSIVLLTAFSALLIAITLFCGGLGFGRLFGIYGIMEYCLLGMLVIIDILVIYKVYKLYAMQPKTIMLLLGLECCSIFFVVCLYQYRPKSIGLANYKLHIASCQFRRLHRR